MDGEVRYGVDEEAASLAAFLLDLPGQNRILYFRRLLQVPSLMPPRPLAEDLNVKRKVTVQMRKIHLSIQFFIGLVLALSLAPAVSAAQPKQDGATCIQEVTVQADDWLSKIAEKVYGDPLLYPVIVEATNVMSQADDSFAKIEDPDLIEIGWKLCLPEAPDMAADGLEAEAKAMAVASYLDEVATYVDLHQTLQPVPLLTAQVPDLSYDEAYTFQEQYTKALQNNGQEQIGYKLGLTGPQKPFGATEAIYGRLFDSMRKEDGDVINTTDFVKGMIEVELAFTFASDVSYPITTEALQASVREIAPAIELPDLIFSDMQNLSWLDLIATGVAPRQMIVGAGMPLDGLDVNTVQTVAKLNGEVINEAPASDALGNQWDALLFLAEKLNERGYRIEAGDVVITGALGNMLPGKPGTYEIDYGELGQINFEIQ